MVRHLIMNECKMFIEITYNDHTLNMNECKNVYRNNVP